MTAATVTVPHAGPGTHTLLVAIEVDDRDLARPDLLDDVLTRVRELATPVLAERHDQAVDHLIRDVLDQHQVDLDQVRAKSREVRIVRARRHVCWVLRQAGWSFPRIGQFIERDHTTVMHAIRSYDGVQNESCEECGADPLGGGRWCLEHYQEYVDKRRRQDGRRRAS
jgi:hypothetical protein